MILSLHGEYETTGTGLTVTTAGFPVPGQLLAVDWALYVTASIEEPVLFKVWAIEFPDPDEYPFTLPELPVAVHVKVDPVTWEANVKLVV